MMPRAGAAAASAIPMAAECRMNIRRWSGPPARRASSNIHTRPSTAKPRSGHRNAGRRLCRETVIQGSSYGVVHPHALKRGSSQNADSAKASPATAESQPRVRAGRRDA
jgi:hypothetical protein